jgi:ABC-type transport system involved in Fe-S cluster assembly fused permease/ATPase subunit
MELSFEKVLLAKKTAMSRCFWTACPKDEDDGFDRLLTFKSIKELENEDWGAVFLHRHLEKFELDQIQEFVYSQAVKLLCVMTGVIPDVAMSALNKWKTTEVKNGGHYYEMPYSGVKFLANTRM